MRGISRTDAFWLTEAKYQGRSDAHYGYRRDPGDFEDDAAVAYNEGYEEVLATRRPNAGFRRTPSGTPPRRYTRTQESYTAARQRWLPRWLDWRDLCVMTELNYQDSLQSVPIKHKHFRKAFWGVEMRYVTGPEAV